MSKARAGVKTKNTVIVWECPIHGLIEATLTVRDVLWHEHEATETWEECPVSTGCDDVCHTRLSGPMEVRRPDPCEAGQA